MWRVKISLKCYIFSHTVEIWSKPLDVFFELRFRGKKSVCTFVCISIKVDFFLLAWLRFNILEVGVFHVTLLVNLPPNLLIGFQLAKFITEWLGVSAWVKWDDPKADLKSLAAIILIVNVEKVLLDGLLNRVIQIIQHDIRLHTCV